MTTQCYKRHIVGCLGVREEVGYRHAQAPEKDNFHMKEKNKYYSSFKSFINQSSLCVCLSILNILTEDKKLQKVSDKYCFAEFENAKKKHLHTYKHGNY